MKKSLTLLIAVAGLALVAWGLDRESSLEDKTILPRLSFDKSADRIDVDFEGKAVELVKDENSWKIKEGDDLYPSDEPAVHDVTKTLSKLELQDIVSKNKDRYAEFGFEEVGAVSVSWFEGETKKGAVYIGGQYYARGGDYLRIGEEGAVYITKNHIRSVFARGSFKDTRLAAVSDTGLVSKIAWEYPKDASSITLVKKTGVDGVWVFEGDENKSVNQAASQAVAGYLATLKAEDVIKYDANFDYGFNAPALTLRITIDGKEETVMIGKQPSEASPYYARVSGKDGWVYL
ncbi:MAG: DUF4340 domain-containing protein, partial [Candidatus Jacksonbacteria bacterium]|nr:DUF4340 domain-containing protein [Candidatus Jacksonbacteria bacterium]